MDFDHPCVVAAALQLENQLEAYTAKIGGLHLQIRALCSDWWFGHNLSESAKETGRAIPLVLHHQFLVKCAGMGTDAELNV